MTQPPTGIARRRRRLSDEETERRMLAAGAAMFNRNGLTVSIEHLGLEEIIQEAQVSRSTVYRRWPYKDLFLSDLLRELAKAASPARVASAATTLPAVRQVLLDHLDWLATADRRGDLLLELIRVGSEHDFAAMRGSVEWRTYLALQATFLSVVDDALRADLQASLVQSERSFIGRIARAWERLSGLLGYRLRPETGVTFETVAGLLSASIRGHVLMGLANPDAVTRPIEARLPGASGPVAWTLPALAAASIALTFFEPDPAIAWDDRRIEQVAEALRNLELEGDQDPQP